MGRGGERGRGGEGEGVDKLRSHYQIGSWSHTQPFFVTSCNAFPTKRKREAMSDNTKNSL